VRRVSVVGNSGSGKTTLARELASSLAVPHIELDAMFHQPGWQELGRDEFRQRVVEATAAPRWVVDGNYGAVRDIVWEAADTVVWVDPPQAVVMSQVVRRTLRRVVTRQELWNGNREPWSNLWSLNPATSIVAWAWTQRTKYRDRYSAAMVDPRLGHMRFIRVRNDRDRRKLLVEAQALRAVRPTGADRAARSPDQPE